MQVFVDESKAGGYAVVAALVQPADVSDARRSLRELLLPGQRRIHFLDESERRRRMIIDRLIELDLRTTVYEAGPSYRTDRARRAACLEALVADHAPERETLLYLELDQSCVDADRRVLYAATRATGCGDRLRYHHVTPGAEPLVWVPDAVAWSYKRGGEWRRRVAPLIAGIVPV